MKKIMSLLLFVMITLSYSFAWYIWNSNSCNDIKIGDQIWAWCNSNLNAQMYYPWKNSSSVDKNWNIVWALYEKNYAYTHKVCKTGYSLPTFKEFETAVKNAWSYSNLLTKLKLVYWWTRYKDKTIYNEFWDDWYLLFQNNNFIDFYKEDYDERNDNLSTAFSVRCIKNNSFNNMSLINSSWNNFWFFWNLWLNICLPFWWIFTGNIWGHSIGINLNKNCNNKCYIPLFGVNGGFGFASNSIAWNMNFGIYYDCNTTTKEKVIQDYCNEIKTRVIEKVVNAKCDWNIFSPDYWMCNMFSVMSDMWNNMSLVWEQTSPEYWQSFVSQNPFDNMNTSKQYISIFKSPQDNKTFYNTYCVNNNYLKDYEICDNWQTKTVKMYDLSDYLNNWAVIWKCKTTNNNTNTNTNTNSNNNTNNNTKLPPYMRIDYKNSTIILYYGKNYQINR